jgi:hypothetical protein
VVGVGVVVTGCEGMALVSNTRSNRELLLLLLLVL